jgi:CubicO group peptidase (beta-lactamase class C family)
MTYVVSDLHGNHAAFQNLLKKINFTEDDILYVVGDIVDYGEYSMDLLCEISMMPNVYAVVGEHDRTALRMLSAFDKMSKSGEAPTPESAEEMSRRVREDGGAALPKTNLFTIGDEYESGGAALISNVPDYARFADAMANGGVGETGKSILLPNTIDLMRENRVGNLMETDCTWPQLAGYGYGFGVRTLISRGAAGSLSSLGEFGWDGAKGVYVVIDPSRKLSLTYAEHRGGDKYLVQPRLRNLAYACLDLD